MFNRLTLTQLTVFINGCYKAADMHVCTNGTCKYTQLTDRQKRLN